MNINKEILFINFGEVRAAYEMPLNDKYLGSAAFPDFRFPVYGILKEIGAAQTN